LNTQKNKVSNEDMFKILAFCYLEPKQYTDSALVYEVTFDTLATIYNLGKDHGTINIHLQELL